jgi:hypothetical protein
MPSPVRAFPRLIPSDRYQAVAKPEPPVTTNDSP